MTDEIIDTQNEHCSKYYFDTIDESTRYDSVTWSYDVMECEYNTDYKDYANKMAMNIIMGEPTDHTLLLNCLSISDKVTLLNNKVFTSSEDIYNAIVSLSARHLKAQYFSSEYLTDAQQHKIIMNKSVLSGDSLVFNIMLDGIDKELTEEEIDIIMEKIEYTDCGIYSICRTGAIYKLGMSNIFKLINKYKKSIHFCMQFVSGMSYHSDDKILKPWVSQALDYCLQSQNASMAVSHILAYSHNLPNITIHKCVSAMLDILRGRNSETKCYGNNIRYFYRYLSWFKLPDSEKMRIYKVLRRTCDYKAVDEDMKKSIFNTIKNNYNYFPEHVQDMINAENMMVQLVSL